MTDYVIRPDAAVGQANVNLVGGATTAAVLGDDSDSSWVQHFAAGTPSYALVGLGDLTLAAGETITRVRVRIRYMTGLGSTDMWVILENAAGQQALSDYYSAAVASITTFTGQWWTVGPDGGAWTQSTLNALRIRVHDGQGGSTKAAVRALYIDVETQPNRAPNIPVLLSPVGGEVLDNNVSHEFSWQFSDPDYLGTQGGWDLEYRSTGETLWTTVSGIGPSTSTVRPAGSFTLGDGQWRLTTRDQFGVASPVSAVEFFTVVETEGPVITAPAAGSTVSTSTALLEWLVDDQDAFRIRVYADEDGLPTGAALYDSGAVVDDVARSAEVPLPNNNLTRHISLAINVDGLWSDEATVRVLVSFTQPWAPILSVTPDDPEEGAIGVTAEHPDSVGSVPEVIFMHLWRRQLGDTGDGRLLAPNLDPDVIYVDWEVADHQAYEYRTEAWGSNGTVVFSEWADSVPIPIDPEGTAFPSSATFPASTLFPGGT
jgi:hypothetical protein